MTVSIHQRKKQTYLDIPRETSLLFGGQEQAYRTASREKYEKLCICATTIWTRIRRASPQN